MLDGQVKLFAAMLHEEKAVIAQHRIPDDTTETTQVRELLEHVDLDGAVVTADAVSAQRDTAAYIAGNEEDGGRGSAYFLFVKGNQPKLQRAVFDAIQRDCPPRPRLHRTGPRPRPDHPPLPLGRRCRGRHRFPSRQAGRADPPRRLRR